MIRGGLIKIINAYHMLSGFHGTKIEAFLCKMTNDRENTEISLRFNSVSSDSLSLESVLGQTLRFRQNVHLQVVGN